MLHIVDCRLLNANFFSCVGGMLEVQCYFSNVNEYENGNNWYAFTKTKTRMMLIY